MSMLPIDIASLRTTFPDWRIIEGHRMCWAIRRHEVMPGSSRIAAIGRPVILASTLTALAIQLAALDCPLGITPTG